MNDLFFVVGPTAGGKSELAAEVAAGIDAEIVNADAFQIYRGFDVLSAKPSPATLARVRHHLIGAVSAAEKMNAEKFRRAARAAVDDIRSRGKRALVVGGSGLYIKALTDGLTERPPGNPEMRRRLDRLGTEELRARLVRADPEGAQTIDLANRRRVMRALEICLITGKTAPAGKTWSQKTAAAAPARGFFVFRDREELYQRINQRVEWMMAHGAIEEVDRERELSETAARMIGVAQIRAWLSGEISKADCIAAIQQATRQYAKRQLTWFRRQTSFEPLNLSLLSHHEAVEWVSRRAVAGRARG